MNRIQRQPDGSVLTMLAESDEEFAVSVGYSRELYEVEAAYNGKLYVAGEAPVQTLEEAKEDAKAKADAAKEKALVSPAVITVNGVGDVLHDDRAEQNVSGLVTLMPALDLEEVEFILADDTPTNLTQDQLKAIALAFMARKQSIYAAKTAAFAAIDAAETIEELNNL